MKTRQDNDMIDRIGLVHVEIENERSRPIWLCTVYDED